MITGKLNKSELFLALDNIEEEVLRLILPLSEKEINTIPFKDSWSAAQVLSHVTKSTASIVQALNMESKKVERKPDERVQELKKMFLDFTTKMKSPAFILPANDAYNKESLINDFKKSFELLKRESRNINLAEAIDHPAFGDVTKLELLHFVLYHTQRHTHQANKIAETLSNVSIENSL